MKTRIMISGMALVLLVGCSAPYSKYNWALYRNALTKSQGTTLPAASDTEQAALKRFSDFYEVYSVEVITSHVASVYADDAYFGDPYACVEGLPAIREYFVRMAEPVDDCRFHIEAVDRTEDGEYYIRWMMKLALNRSPDQTIEALGISHVRFNNEGKVVFQQDYWDSSVVFERLPLAGPPTRWIKQRLE
jgi:hypothetical protein